MIIEYRRLLKIENYRVEDTFLNKVDMYHSRIVFASNYYELVM